MSNRSTEPHVALIVEDDQDVRELAAALLEETDLDVVAMIFADVRLPGTMDGVHLAKVACTLWPTIRVVLTSGASGDRIDGLPDCVAYMPKPWRGLDVLREAEKAMREPQSPVV
jgi:FixJ family two-component response regulator